MEDYQEVTCGIGEDKKQEEENQHVEIPLHTLADERAQGFHRDYRLVIQVAPTHQHGIHRGNIEKPSKYAEQAGNE